MPSALPSPELGTSPSWSIRPALSAHRSRLARFALVGASGVLVNVALLSLLVEVVGWGDVAAAALATEAAIINNFVLNDRWTFRGVQSCMAWIWRVLRYNLVALGGLSISVAVLAVLTRWFGLHYLVADLLAIGAGFLWNYLIGSTFAWSVSGPARRTPACQPPSLSDMSGVRCQHERV